MEVDDFLALQLKNTLYSREEHLKQVYQERWLNIPDNIRNHVKNNVKIPSPKMKLMICISSSVSMLSEQKQADHLKQHNVLVILLVQNYLVINGQI